MLLINIVMADIFELQSDFVPLIVQTDNQRQRQRRTRPCRFWLQGNCKYGDKCWFAHTSFTTWSTTHQDSFRKNLKAGLQKLSTPRQKGRCFCGNKLIRIPKRDMDGNILMFFTLCKKTKKGIQRCRFD